MLTNRVSTYFTKLFLKFTVVKTFCMMNTKLNTFVKCDTVPLLELGEPAQCNRPRHARRASVVESMEKLMGRRRGSIGQFLEKRRESVIGRIFGHAEVEVESESAEDLEMQRKLRQVQEKLDQRSNHQSRARVRCVDEPDDDDVPYELMGQILVLSLLAILLLFAWIADMEGIPSTRV